MNPVNNKGTLVVMPGAKLIANGTCSNPVVWTSSRSAGSRSMGDWNGIVILGRSLVTAATGAHTNFFEWLSNRPENYYGGTDAADNSGSITYNRIEFTGGSAVPLQNNEFNGLSLCDHLISLGNRDDDFDFDEALVCISGGMPGSF